jgi:hypothetical protein
MSGGVGFERTTRDPRAPNGFRGRPSLRFIPANRPSQNAVRPFVRQDFGATLRRQLAPASLAPGSASPRPRCPGRGGPETARRRLRYRGCQAGTSETLSPTRRTQAQSKRALGQSQASRGRRDELRDRRARPDGRRPPPDSEGLRFGSLLPRATRRHVPLRALVLPGQGPASLSLRRWRTLEVEAGDAFHVRPGHLADVLEQSELIEFTPAAAYRRKEEHLARQAEAGHR